MEGKGILRSMGVTLKRFVDTYVEDIKWLGKRYYTEEGIESRRSADATGIFTIQYPEEKMPVPEEFRFIPFLIYEVNEDGEKKDRCTSCGICAKVCPYNAITFDETENVTKINPALCQGCGTCVAACPSGAITGTQFSNEQVLAQLEGLFSFVGSGDGSSVAEPEPAS